MRLPQSAAGAFVRFARKTTGDFFDITDKNYCLLQNRTKCSKLNRE